jgi:hypothetical protein
MKLHHLRGLLTGLVLTGLPASLALAQPKAPPSPPTTIEVEGCDVSVSDVRTRYPTLAQFLSSEYIQDFAIIHGNGRVAAKNFFARQPQKRRDLQREIRAFRDEYKTGNCSIAAWRALGAGVGTTASFINDSLSAAESEAGT